MKKITKKQLKEEDKQEARESLKRLLTPGQTIYTVLKKVSASGVYRKIDLLAVIEGKIKNMNWYYLRASGDSIKNWEKGIGVGGAGMDMGFHLVYNLGRICGPFLCIGENCPSNDHVNDRNFRREKNNIGKEHSDSGYMFNHEWL